MRETCNGEMQHRHVCDSRISFQRRWRYWSKQRRRPFVLSEGCCHGVLRNRQSEYRQCGLSVGAADDASGRNRSEVSSLLLRDLGAGVPGIDITVADPFDFAAASVCGGCGRLKADDAIRVRRGTDSLRGRPPRSRTTAPAWFGRRSQDFRSRVNWASGSPD